MRKLIILALLFVGSLCILFRSAFPLIPGYIETFDEIPSGLVADVYHARNYNDSGLTVSFSVNDFFHNETIFVSIHANDPNAAIYYTIDGSTPTTSSSRFTEPIVLEADETVNVIVLKSIAINGLEESRVYTQTYFVGTGVHERFSTYVFSISTDGYNLYDYDYGILVPGRIRDEWLEANPDPELARWWWPANYRMTGREWERPVSVEVFTQEGTRIVAQNAGIRVYGGATRYYPQKSLRLTARREYEPGIGRFHYEFFENHMSFGPFSRPIVSYNSLILRNDGQDFWRARLRTPLASRIALDAGFPVVSPVNSAAVFINGEYYGYITLNVRIDEQYLEDLFDAPERSFQLINGGGRSIATNDEYVKHEFERLLEYASHGFDDETIQAVHDFFDIDNMLFYYAIQTYIGNDDWPHTNIRIWRYTGSQDVSNLAPEMDGRWRFIMWDLDFAFDTFNNTPPETRSIYRLLDGLSPIFAALLQRPEYAETFANYVSDMAFEHFGIDNVERVIQELDSIGLQELAEYYRFTDQELAEYYGFAQHDFEGMLESREVVLDFAILRSNYILQELKDLFGYTETFRIVSDGSVKINSLNGNEGVYFIENSVPVTPVLQQYHVLDHWLINGEVRYEKDLWISSHYANSDGIVHVHAVTRQVLPPLLFKDTFDNGELFGFTMYNPTDTVQSTQGLYLSDRLDNPRRWQFPDLNIHPGNSWTFAGRSSTSPDALLMFALNFNPRYGEVIFLSNEDGGILDFIVMER
jgi:hypothetical protein